MNDLNAKMKVQIFNCPRCGSFDIIEYLDSIECPRCQLEFEKSDINEVEEEDVLSIEEKLAICKALKEEMI